MAQDFLLLRQFVAALIYRERALLGIRIAARAALLLLAALLWAAVSAAVPVDRPAAGFVLVALLGVGAWFAVALPVLSTWADVSDPLRQARRVESLLPELRGRLVTAVGHADGVRPGESEALLGLVVRKASEAVQSVRAEDVYPAQATARVAGAVGVAWLAGIVVLAVLGPSRVGSFWFRSFDARADVAAAAVKTSEDEARVGDLVLRYVYPDYTGLPPKVVPNSTGDAAGPPGTRVEVTARSGDAVEAAGLVAYDEPLEARVDADGRTVSAAFSIAEDAGTWRLLLYRGGEPERSRAFAVTPEKDLPPDVVLQEQDRLEVALDETFELHWQARDDFGVAKVVLAVDGKDSERVLEEPRQRRAEITSVSRLSPRALKLAPGDRVKISIAAWDNDTVAGSKRGESRAIELVVLGASGLDRRAEERRQELLDTMIPILARLLTDPDPPGRTGGALARWGEEVAARYRPLSDVAERLWSGMETRTQDHALVQRVLDTARKLVRYTQVSFEPSSEVPVSAESLGMVGSLRDDSVLALENAVLALAEMLQSEAIADIVAQAKDLSAAADTLEELAKRPDATAQELTARLDQADRMLQQLARAAEKLQQSGLREFINLRQSEIANLSDEIRKALAEGRLEDARRMLDRLADQIREMSQGIQDEMARRQQRGDEAQQKAEALKAELERLEGEQRALQAEVQALRKQDGSASQQSEQLWTEIARRVEAYRSGAGRYVSDLEANDRPFFEVERSREGVEAGDRMAAAAKVRDLTGARIALEEARLSWGAIAATIRRMEALGTSLKGPGQREIRALQQQLDAIAQLLDQLEQAASQVDPRTLERSQALEQRQRDLESQLQQAGEQAEQLSRQFPVRPEGMEEAIEDAKGRMQRASDDLQQGQPMQAEGSQGVAAQRIRDAIESIEQAQRQAREQSRPSQGQSSEGGEQAEGGGVGEQPNRMEMEIPRRDEYVAPAEYRRLLLEGMEGEVPEEYRALKQRYFEELVHQ